MGLLQILIVDDDEILLELLVALVESRGYRAITAMNGQDALVVLHHCANPPVLIISDAMMPFMNGIEFVKRVRAEEHYRRIPVILTSAAATMLGDGLVDFFVVKPFDLTSLTTLIDQCVQHPATT